MSIYEIIKKRKSVRAFDKKEVPEDVINRIMDTARIAPSAKNRQEWRFIIVKDGEKKKQLSAAAKNQSFIKDASVVLVCCGIDDGYIMTCGQPAYSIDTAIAIDHITLCAVEEGLGTCWIGAFYEDKVKEILDIPEGVRVLLLLPVGYPKDDSKKEKNRLSMKEIVSKEKWDF